MEKLPNIYVVDHEKGHYVAGPIIIWCGAVKNGFWDRRSCRPFVNPVTVSHTGR